MLVEEDDDTGDVVDYRNLCLPGSIGCVNYGVCCFFTVVGLVEWLHQLRDFLVGEEFEDAVRADHDGDVFWLQEIVSYFRFGNHTDFMGFIVSNRSRHRQSRCTRMLEPNSHRPHEFSLALQGLDPPSSLLDPQKLLRIIRFLVFCEWKRLSIGCDKNSPRIACICSKKVSPADEHSTEGGS